MNKEEMFGRKLLGDNCISKSWQVALAWPHQKLHLSTTGEVHHLSASYTILSSLTDFTCTPDVSTLQIKWFFLSSVTTVTKSHSFPNP